MCVLLAAPKRHKHEEQDIGNTDEGTTIGKKARWIGDMRGHGRVHWRVHWEYERTREGALEGALEVQEDARGCAMIQEDASEDATDVQECGGTMGGSDSTVDSSGCGIGIASGRIDSIGGILKAYMGVALEARKEVLEACEGMREHVLLLDGGRRLSAVHTAFIAGSSRERKRKADNHPTTTGSSEGVNGPGKRTNKP
ncbi:hypothetical protein DFJ58DRAFT_837125 [Suillus subalutaceus]|uniref:uncharacterized protein n=1 Tax=Suillus subalutaceus TaxID=48586 RepID=UPI001B882269|nr:uncharacterized protein DFJ58DRAFT_837125 [Suillus subalutaceus]KAG1871811.1 hypothetical protein DFJ58DRAFT_837125 [Suillus subalutaceus]